MNLEKIKNSFSDAPEKKNFILRLDLLEDVLWLLPNIQVCEEKSSFKMELKEEEFCYYCIKKNLIILTT